ncbi:adenosylcobinamide-GDP ribazoletransferase [Acinetobacter larvae]|uniref:Adenosylcobinamide-GDP ribazoletransferase n=1 Tax=Acinetobacter larvae TaxID=1789224 RepID=A0A1B2M0Z0_9GAMM|nr:adenosylcobinamide-GDP ribazoletransferase [Acinetobacter larvae]AOA58683.1 adenosylcobinamide-GDP ribazoletransferase [Acinetobacter larvae]
MKAFLVALQFLTTIPIRLKQAPSELQQAASVLFYPVIGMIIGALLFAVAYLLHPLPIILSSTLLLVLWVLLTGGLHLDGLADTCDAWMDGNADPQRRLSIMKDPHCGTMGVLSLMMLCLLKWSALYVILAQHHLSLLIISPVLGRAAAMLLLLTTEYVRESGLAAAMSQHLHQLATSTILLLCIAFSVLWSIGGLIAIGVLTLFTCLLRATFIKRFGGITGDTLGASIEIAEVVVLFTMLIYLLS